jgi:transcription antitermination factor NusG
MSDRAGCCQDDPGNSPAARKWFAVFTTARHEKRVEAHLRLREIENFLPIYQRQRKWKDGSKGTLRLPLFSCYIFARIGRVERVPVLQVPGVISIIGFGLQPLPVSDSYIHLLREGLRHGKIEPHQHLTVGTRVRICSGAMAGLEGVLLRRTNNLRVVLTLEVIMKSVTVEVEIGDIEPLGRTSYASLMSPAASA